MGRNDGNTRKPNAPIKQAPKGGSGKGSGGTGGKGKGPGAR